MHDTALIIMTSCRTSQWMGPLPQPGSSSSLPSLLSPCLNAECIITFHPGTVQWKAWNTASQTYLPPNIVCSLQGDSQASRLRHSATQICLDAPPPHPQICRKILAAGRYVAGADPGHHDHSEAGSLSLASPSPAPPPPATLRPRVATRLASALRSSRASSRLVACPISAAPKEAAPLVGGVRGERDHSVLSRRLRARVCGCALRKGRTQSPAEPPTRLVPRALPASPRLGIAPRPPRRASARPSAWGCPSPRATSA